MKKIIFAALVLVLINCIPCYAARIFNDGPTISELFDGSYVVDSYITGRVKSAFLLDNDLKNYDLSVTTENRVVLISGIVKSEIEYKLAEELASNIEGVKSVINKIDYPRRNKLLDIFNF